MAARFSQIVQSHYRKGRDVVTSRFTERQVVLGITVVAGLFVLTLLVGPFLPRYRGDLHGAASKPVFEFESLDHDVFVDVPGDHPHAYALSYLKKRGMIHGYAEDNTFRPDETMNRAVFMKMLSGARRAHPHRLRYSHCFDDVQNEWFAPYVCFGKERGWIESEAATFEPDRLISRGDALKTFMLAFNVPGGNGVSQFEDVRADDWYGPYVLTAEEKGWLGGFIEGPRFDADAEMNRSEVAELLFRVVVTELPL